MTQSFNPFPNTRPAYGGMDFWAGSQYVDLHRPTVASVLKHPGTDMSPPAWGTVGSAEITDGSITGTDIANGTVTVANMANRTYHIWIPASEFVVTSGLAGAPAPFGSTANAYEKFQAVSLTYSGVTDVIMVADYDLPSDWNAGAVTLTAEISPTDNNAGNIALLLSAAPVAVGGQLDATIVSNGVATVAAGGVQEARVQSSVSAYALTGGHGNIYIWWNCSGGTNTYAHNVYFKGMTITYVATP